MCRPLSKVHFGLLDVVLDHMLGLCRARRQNDDLDPVLLLLKVFLQILHVSILLHDSFHLVEILSSRRTEAS